MSNAARLQQLLARHLLSSASVSTSGMILSYRGSHDQILLRSWVPGQLACFEVEQNCDALLNSFASLKWW